MKAINRAIEKFCRKHSRFGIPRLMLYIVILSAVVYVINMMDTTATLLSILAFSPARILHGEIWRIVTWIFCPVSGQLLFVALSLYFYYFIGSSLEREWGVSKFTVYYILGIVLNIIYGFVVWVIMEGPALMSFGVALPIPLVPNYVNLSMFFAFAVLFPDQVIMLFFFIPIKIKWLALVDAALFAYSIVTELIHGSIVLALLPIVAILNFFIVCGYDLYVYLRPYNARNAAGTIRFRTAAKHARREQEKRQYKHKCSVCGKTDAEFPDLEFRYCSRCEGYHCFCIEHINNHVHFR